MLKYIFSLFLSVLFTIAGAQEEDQEKEVTRIRGLRLGYDLSRHALPWLDGGRSGFEASADMELNMNLYAAMEYGMQDVNEEKEGAYNYTSHGYYFRGGVDYNFLKNLNVEQYEMVFGGLRLGYASLYHSAWAVQVPPNYWGKEDYRGVPRTTVQTYWLEVAGGVKAELFKNVFIGWSVRGRIRLAQLYPEADPVMEPVYVPGYGPGNERASVGFSYSVFYRIPLMHYVPKPKKKEE